MRNLLISGIQGLNLEHTFFSQCHKFMYNLKYFVAVVLVSLIFKTPLTLSLSLSLYIYIYIWYQAIRANADHISCVQTIVRTNIVKNNLAKRL
jgi:hypothetical protein